MALSSVIIFEFSDLNIIIKSFYFLKALRSTGPAVAHLRPLSLLASSKAGGKVSLDTCSHSHLDHANFWGQETAWSLMSVMIIKSSSGSISQPAFCFSFLFFFRTRSDLWVDPVFSAVRGWRQYIVVYFTSFQTLLRSSPYIPLKVYWQCQYTLVWRQLRRCLEKMPVDLADTAGLFI